MGVSHILARRPEEGMDALDLDLQVAVSTPLWVLGTGFWLSARAKRIYIPEPSIISPAPAMRSYQAHCVYKMTGAPVWQEMWKCGTL